MIGELDGCAGRRASSIAGAHLGRAASDLSFEESGEILDAATREAKKFNIRRIRQLGKEAFDGSHASVRGESTLNPGRGGRPARLPYSVEAWAAPSDDENGSIVVLVNRTPVAAAVDTWRAKKRTHIVISGCGLHHTVTATSRSIDLVLNIQTPYMPITSDGKEPDLSLFVGAVRRVALKAARACQRSNAGSQGSKTSVKEAILAVLESAIAKQSDGGRYRYSLRNLFYTVRDEVTALGFPEPKWSWFCGMITDHENESGTDLPGITRDNRGTVYHPHCREAIQIGTLTVEGYETP